MPALVLSLALLLPQTPDVLDLAERLCVQTAGDFNAFERSAADIGTPLADQERKTALGGYRTADRAVGYQVGTVTVVLANLPGGIRNVPAPVQTAGEPTVMWDFDFPQLIVCDVRTASLPIDWADVIDGWVIGGRRLSPLTTHLANERSWSFPGGGFIQVKTPNGQPAQISVSYRKNP